MALVGIFPEALLTAERKDDFIALLASLPIPPRRKKELLVEWTQLVGAVLTRDMVEQLLGSEAEKVRG